MKKQNWEHVWDFKDNYLWMEKVNKLPPLIITCAVNGGIQGKEVNPAIPETPKEIADSSYDAYNAGASIVHIHARDRNKQWINTDDYEDFLETNGAVRNKCHDIIINNSTGGGYKTTMESRLKVLDAKPEMASLNMGPFMEKFTLKQRGSEFIHPHEEMEVDGIIPFTYGFIEKLSSKMLEKDIKAEMEVYHPGQYWSVNHLIDKGLVKPPYYIQFVMGAQTSSYPTPQNVLGLLNEFPRDGFFSTIGVGKFQWALTTFSIIMGGHVRVGLEDNIYLERGRKLISNGEAVEKIVRIARELGRNIATPKETRAMLDISPIPSSY